LPSDQELETVLGNAVNAQRQWKKATLEDRIAVGERFIKAFQDLGPQISQDLTVQMGRPTCQGMVEVNGTLERARRMIDLARESLADVVNPVSRTEWIHTVESDIIAQDTDTPTHKRYIKKVPLGVIFCISPWNWPLFCQVNVVLPAILAGNSVILKPSPQTPLSGECFQQAFEQARLPPHVLQVVHLAQDQTIEVVGDSRVDFVNFTGSVANGHLITKAASESFKGLALEVSFPRILPSNFADDISLVARILLM
jgi:acyl-CoA reductase-like NAD-dependent aldehyde dehydrogenase